MSNHFQILLDAIDKHNKKILHLLNACMRTKLVAICNAHLRAGRKVIFTSTQFDMTLVIKTGKDEYSFDIWCSAEDDCISYDPRLGHGSELGRELGKLIRDCISAEDQLKYIVDSFEFVTQSPPPGAKRVHTDERHH